jgi:phosphomannomutase
MAEQQVQIDQLMTSSGVTFGTSGIRGLVVDMTDQVCWLYVSAFLQYLAASEQLQPGGKVAVAGDLRFSSPRIMAAAMQAVQDHGYKPVNCGHVPTPAVALYGFNNNMPSMMVTGSHIPDDRNGIKFNTPTGEILKADELAIRQQSVLLPIDRFDSIGVFITSPEANVVSDVANDDYIARFIAFLPPGCLKGKNIGLYEHSSVSRDCLKVLLEALGASVVSLGRSEAFVSVDTEAIRVEDVVLAREWASEYDFDCIISTDGDGDRPLVSDEKGNWLRGDVAGILCAKYLQADRVVTPISSNSAVEKSDCFEQVERTRIGSPYVIEAMTRLLSRDKVVVGYEANGGFLQASDIILHSKVLGSLPTRDAAIVPLAILLLADEHSLPISELLMTLPTRYTASDRLKAFPTTLSQSILATMQTDNYSENIEAIQQRFPDLGVPIDINTVDGVRMTFESEDIVHLRPSGNAPELRCYTESDTIEGSFKLNQDCIKLMDTWR